MPSNRRERRHPELVGIQEAADYCGVNIGTIRRWLRAGHVSAVRVGPRNLRFDPAELDKVFQPVGGAQ